MRLPAFSLPANDGKTYTEGDFASGIFVIFVYPRDMTPGCTIEAHDFSDALPDFAKSGVRVFGLSKDSLASHDTFCEKESLLLTLLSDEDKALITALDTWKEKNMYGKKVMGVARSTFLIKDGEIIKEWRGVKVPGHVAEVLTAVKSLH